MEQQQFEDRCMPIPESGCLIWMGKSTRKYGQIETMKNGKRSYEYMHRIAYERAKGPIPAGMLVCHKCDVGFCVNPDHLFLGTPKDNSQDMKRKGRHRNQNTDKERNMGTLTATSFRIQVQYKTRRGGHMVKWLVWDLAIAEIQRLAKNGTEAEAFYTDINGNRRDRAGAVWKNEGRWAWYFDATPQSSYAST